MSANEVKNTPKPWSIAHFARPEVNCKCGYVVVQGYCGAVATVHFSEDRELQNGDNPPFAEAVANAHLIASAPDLLEALKACHLQMLQSNNDSEYADEANQLAIAAIAKAEGPESGKGTR